MKNGGTRIYGVVLVNLVVHSMGFDGEVVE